MKSWDIVGYTYCAGNYCPHCIHKAMGNMMSPAIEDCERVLDMIAKNDGIDRYDEASYDSSDFPKVIFADQANEAGEYGGERETCGWCGEEL